MCIRDRTTVQGAIAGMVAGGVVSIFWYNMSGGIFDIYEIIPGFLFSSLALVLVSLCTKVPAEIEEEFETVRKA